MTYQASWKHGYGFFKADAQKVADEILTIGDEVTPAQILEKARDNSTELHKCFEWDDSIAAERYRLSQAGQVLRLLVIKETPKSQGSYERRLLYKTSSDEGYKPIMHIERNQDEYLLLRNRAYNELQIFERKYHSIVELEEVFEAFHRVSN